MKSSFNVSNVGHGLVKPKRLAHARHGGRPALLLPALLMIAVSMQAQTVTALFSFCPPPDNNCSASPDGAYPESSLTPDGAGGFYSTTYEGGLVDYGTVFKLSRNASGGWDETVIYKFTGGAAGDNPWFSNVILDKSGNLYGTLSWGGTGNEEEGYGVVFQLSRVAGVWTENVLYRFLGGTDGAHPINGLVMDEEGNLYGKTMDGGTGGNGTVFEVSPSSGGWTERVIYNLDAGYGGLAIDKLGNIFSTSSTTVFELSPNGTGGWSPRVLHTFEGAQDGSFPVGVPVLHAGSLYGVTASGGSANQGTVYRLVLQGNTEPKEEILYSFPGGSGGAQPWTGVVFDPAKNIYGTTLSGGPNSGFVYELVAPVGTGNYTEKILGALSEVGGLNAWCYSTLIRDKAGNLYGTTEGGGSNGAGTVFEVSP